MSWSRFTSGAGIPGGAGLPVCGAGLPLLYNAVVQECPSGAGIPDLVEQEYPLGIYIYKEMVKLLH